MAERGDLQYDADSEVIDVDELEHPRKDKRYATGIDSGHSVPSVPHLLRELDYLWRKAQELQGGAQAAGLGGKVSGGEGRDSPDWRPLEDVRELEKSMRALHVELLRTRRRYAGEILGQGYTGAAGSRERRDAVQTEKVRRIREDYPAWWTNGDVGLAEHLSERWVRQLRGGDRERKAA